MNAQPGSVEPKAPGKVLRELLEARKWTHEDLASITGRSRQAIHDVLVGKAGVTPEMAVALGIAFANGAEEWLRLDSAYRLSRVDPEARLAVEQRARIFKSAPVREMQRRGWIKDGAEPAEIENQLRAFFGVDSLDQPPIQAFAFRKADSAEWPVVSPAQIAWCRRAAQLARALSVQAYKPDRLPDVAAQLRELAAYPKEAAKVSSVLAQGGIRFVVVEPLSGSKVDGAAFWLDADAPVIAVSVRYDRIDAFWFTVFHELTHIRNLDAFSVDVEMSVGDTGEAGGNLQDVNEAERRANQGAAAALIPPRELDSFIGRVGPLYSRPRVIQFAHKSRIHPGIVIGQLQHRGEVGYSAHRDLLVKIRQAVIESAVTDGWGRTIHPELLD